MAERTIVAIHKIMSRWDSVSQSIIENYKNGYINITETQDALIDLRNNLMFVCEVLNILDGETKTLDIIIDKKFEEIFYTLDK